MELDLYQRRGMYGLGEDATGSPAPASLDLSSIGSSLSGQSPWLVLGLGAAGLWILSSIFSSGKKVYGKVARPIKKHRKRKRALKEAGERYERERRRIESGESSRRGGGGFF